MNYLLDTNVLSEVQRPRPAAGVLRWLDTVDEDRVFLSVTSIAELSRGIALMDPGIRKTALSAWVTNDLPARFAGRVIPIDVEVAARWGDLMADSRRRGIALAIMDGFFAATALVTKLTLVTRNVKDFEPFGVALLDPWSSQEDGV